MLPKTDIESNLSSLEVKYDNEPDNIGTLMYSKIALLELCGWIELCMDDVVRRCSNHNLSRQKYKNYIEDPIIKNTYGFSYEGHFRKMLCYLIGLIEFEKIENTMNQQKLQNLKYALKKLKKSRDSEAHTFIESSRTIDAPSVTKQSLQQVFEGLTEFELQLKNKSYLP